jgi:NAD(P)-dependent dehydrogenase (short-subunit alcohol dehydrogenase family)
VTSLRSAFAHILDQQGAPEVLIYNAAAVREGPPSRFDVDAVYADLRVNLGGAILSVGEVLPAMRQNRRGTILLTGGGLALRPSPAYASLAIGKAALRSYALSLSQEVEAEGIHAATVTVAGFVQPGTYFDPKRIAEVYWALHTQPPGAWDREVVYARSES